MEYLLNGFFFFLSLKDLTADLYFYGVCVFFFNAEGAQ